MCWLQNEFNCFAMVFIYFCLSFCQCVFGNAVFTIMQKKYKPKYYDEHSQTRLSWYFKFNAILNEFFFFFRLIFRCCAVFYHYAPLFMWNFRHYFPFWHRFSCQLYFMRHHSFVDKLFWLLHNECLHTHLICTRPLCIERVLFSHRNENSSFISFR